MPIEAPAFAALIALLQQGSAHLVDSTGSKGSGFFIDQELVLTCAHVVKGGEEVEVTPFQRTTRTGHVLEIFPNEDQDVALVQVPAAEGEEPQPAVVLDRAIADNTEYFAVGYPKAELVAAPGQETIAYTGHPRRDNAVAEIQLLALEAGQERVSSGLSGGAVLSSDSGAVVAIVQYSLDTQTDSGGGAIPIGRAAKLLDPVQQLLDQAPAAATRWRHTLGRQAWSALGRPWEVRRSIKVVVSGNRAKWVVKVDPDDGPPSEITIRELEGDVAEAVFQWVQRGRVRDAKQVMRLGKLLSGALFPTPVMKRIMSDRCQGDLAVCLEIDGESELFDVPWEFVTIGSDEDANHLATETGIELVRVGPHASGGGSTVPRANTAAVLGVVVQPPEWQDDMPIFRRDRLIEWPAVEEIEEQLKNALSSPKLDLDLARNPTVSDIEKALSERRFDVLHYVGYGQIEDGVPSIALSDGYDAQFRALTELFDMVCDHEVRVLVIEFLLPRVGVEAEPIMPRTFLEALRGKVNAVVFTRLPVHPRQLFAFNETAYTRLAAGATVEAAVQEARRHLLKNTPFSDPAGFGWFTLLTGPETGTQIVPEGAAQGDATTKQETAREPEAQAAPPPGDQPLATFGGR